MISDDRILELYQLVEAAKEGDEIPPDVWRDLEVIALKHGLAGQFADREETKRVLAKEFIQRAEARRK